MHLQQLGEAVCAAGAGHQGDGAFFSLEQRSPGVPAATRVWRKARLAVPQLRRRQGPHAACVGVQLLQSGGGGGQLRAGGRQGLRLERQALLRCSSQGCRWGGSTRQEGARGRRQRVSACRGVRILQSLSVGALTLSGVLPLLSLRDGQTPEALLLGLRQTALQTRRRLQQLGGVGCQLWHKGKGSLGSRLGGAMLLLLHVLLHPRQEAAFNCRPAAAAGPLAGGAGPRSRNSLGSGCGGRRAHGVVHCRCVGALSACGCADSCGYSGRARGGKSAAFDTVATTSSVTPAAEPVRSLQSRRACTMARRSTSAALRLFLLAALLAVASCGLFGGSKNAAKSGKATTVDTLQIGIKSRPAECTTLAKDGDRVWVHYKGTLLATGEKFDASCA